MFEKLIEGLLQKAIGEYVDGLDAQSQSLKVGLWQGDCQVNNLRLKHDVFLKFGLPFVVKHSCMGTLILNVPWKNLASSPIVVTLESLLVVIQPQDSKQWKFGALTPQDKLAAIEAFKQTLTQKIQESLKQTTKDGMMDRVMIRVIENLQIKIKSIHIRVEDDATCSQSSAYGVVLSELACVTVNKDGAECFVDRTSEASKKLELIKTLKIQNLGVYWETRRKDIPDLSQDIIIKQDDYLFQMSLDAKLIQPPKDREDLPKFQLDINLKYFNIALSKTQAQQVIFLTEYLDRFSIRKTLFQKQNIPKCLNKQQLDTFTILFKQVPLDKKAMQVLTEEQMNVLLEILALTTFEDVKPHIVGLLKDQQKQELIKEALRKKEQPQGMLGGWFGKKQKKQEDKEIQLSQEEQDHIALFLEQQFHEDQQQATNKNRVMLKVNATMESGSISLNNPRLGGQNDGISLVFQGLQCQYTQSSGMEVQLQLYDTQILFNQDQRYHQLFLMANEDTKEPLLVFRIKSVDSFNQDIYLSTRKSKLNYDPTIIPVLQDFFTLDFKSENIRNMADEKYKEMKNTAQVKLAQHAILEKQRRVSISLGQLYILLPIDANRQWVISPGQLSIECQPNEQHKEIYQIKVNDIAFTNCSSLQQNDDPFYVVNKFNVGISIEVPNKPTDQLIITGLVADIQCDMTPEIYRQLLIMDQCLQSNISIEDYKKQSVIITKKEQLSLEEQVGLTKETIINESTKIGPIFLREGALNQWKKYTSVLNKQYLYFFSSPKAQQPTSYKMIKNSTIENKGKDEFGITVLNITNAFYSFEIGIEKQQQINDWIECISIVKDEQAIINIIEEPAIPVASRVVIVQFTLKQVEIHLKDSHLKHFLTIRSDRLSINLQIQQDCLELELTLQGLNASDYLREYLDPTLNYLVKSVPLKDQDQLIRIKFYKINRTSSKYNQCDLLLDISMGSINFNIKSETLAFLLQFIHTKQQQQITDVDIAVQGNMADEYLEASVQYMLLKVQLNIQSINAVIVHEITKLKYVELKFEQAIFNFEKYSDEMNIELRVGNLRVNDLSNYPQTLSEEQEYSQIRPQQLIGVKGQQGSLLELKVKLIEELSRKAQLDRVTLRVDLKINQIILDYYQQPILRLVDYLTNNIKEPFLNPWSFKFNNFSITNNVVNPIINQNNSAITSKIQIDPTIELHIDQVTQYVSNPKQMLINVKIDNPQIVVRAYQQNCYLLINLGEIRVSNKKQQNNGVYREYYNIELTKMNILDVLGNQQYHIAHDFDLSLNVSLPDMVPYYKRLNIKVEDTILITSKLTPLLVSLSKRDIEVIYKILDYNLTMNDYFDDYLILNQGKSYQVTQEQSQIIAEQKIEQRKKTNEYFMKFNLTATNLSVFICNDNIPLLRVSIVDMHIQFNMKKDDKKELITSLQAFDGCIYHKVNNNYHSSALIGLHQESQFTLADMSQLGHLISQCYLIESTQKMCQLELFINPTTKYTAMKLNCTLDTLVMTGQISYLLFCADLFSKPVSIPISNKFHEWTKQIQQQIVVSQDKEQQTQNTEIGIMINLKSLTLALPRNINDESILVLTGSFILIANKYHTLTLEQLLQEQIDQQIRLQDLQTRNYDFKLNFTIDKLEAFITSRASLHQAQMTERRQILKPHSSFFNVNKQFLISDDQEELIDNFVISINMFQTILLISFQDVLFVQSIINANMNILNNKPVIQQDDIKQAIQVIPQLPKGTQRMQLIFNSQEGISITTLNDIGQNFQYLLNLKLDAFQAEYLSLRQNITTSTSLDLALAYYNVNQLRWEPILEKFPLKLAYIQDPKAAAGEKQLLINSDGNINIDISTQSIVTLYSSVQLLKQKMKEKNSSVKIESVAFNKYCLYNLTGYALLGNTIEHDPQYLIVDSMKKAYFDFKDESSNLISLQVQGQLQQFVIDKINVDSKSTKRVTFQNEVVLLKCLIDPISNRKVITVSSDLLIVNTTGYDLNVIFMSTTNQSYELDRLPTYHQVQFGLTANMIAVPMQYQNSKFMIQLNDKQSPPMSMSHIRSKCKERFELSINKLFGLVLNIQPDLTYKGRNVLYLQPFYRIYNWLPFTIQYRLQSGNNVTDIRNVESEKYFDEHAISNQASTTIQFVIESYVQSMQIELLNYKNMKSTTQRFSMKGQEWQGSQGGSSELMLSYDRNTYEETGLSQVYLISNDYLKNETPYEFVVFQGKARTKDYSIVGGQKNGTKKNSLLLRSSLDETDILFSDRNTPRVLSLTAASIQAVGTTYTELFVKQRSSAWKQIPLSVTSEIRLVGKTIQKQITVRPKIIVVNKCNDNLCILQKFGVMEIMRNERSPLELQIGEEIGKLQGDQMYKVQIALLSKEQWNSSGILDLNGVGTLHLQLRSKQDTLKRRFLQLDISDHQGCLFAVVTDTPLNQVPYKITNHSKHVSIDVLILPQVLDYQNKECVFSWDEPCSSKREVPLVLRPVSPQFNGFEYELNIDRVTDARFFKFQSNNRNQQYTLNLKLSIKIEGYTRHAIFTDVTEDDMQRHKDRKQQEISFIDNQDDIVEYTPTNKHQKVALKQQQSTTNTKIIDTKIDITINQIQLSIIDNQKTAPIEVLCVTLLATEAILIISKMQKMTFQLVVSAFQIDNTSSVYPLFPVTLTLLPRNKNAPMLNFLVQMDQMAKEVQLIDKIQLEINALALQLDDQSISNIIDTVTKMQSSLNDTDIALHLDKIQVFDWNTCPIPDKQIPTYINQVIIVPIIVQVTFQLANDKNKSNNDNIFALLGAVGKTLANIDEAQIKFEGIKLDDCFDTVSGLTNKIMQHYKQQALNSMHLLIGSLKIIGNPVGLFKNVAHGFQDLVEKPLDGASQGPLEMGLGVVTGAGSLVSHTISGTFNSVQQIVGSVQSGLTQITMDDEYLNQRQRNKTDRASNVGSGLAQGSKSLAMGVASGLTGLFTKPVEGMQKGGGEGFLKGLWQGTTGLVIKPVTGALDVVTKTSEGIKNQFGSDKQANRKRIRYLRPFYGEEGYYMNYNLDDALGYELMKKLKKGLMANHQFRNSFHLEGNKYKYLLIVSNQSWILYNKSTQSKVWITQLFEVDDVTIKAQVVQIRVKKSKKSFDNNSIAYIQANNEQSLKLAYEDMKASLTVFRSQ